MSQEPPASSSTVIQAPLERPKSASDAMAPAWGNMKRILFEPFSPRKWFKLALIAFLAGVTGGGSRGGGSGGHGGGGGGGGGSGLAQTWDQAVAWCEPHWSLIIMGAVAGCAAILVLSLLMIYVSSVFRFIFMESVITNETRIRDSWRRNQAAGLSYFLWRLGFMLVAVVFTLALVGGPIMLLIAALGWRPGSGPPSGAAIAGSIGLVVLAVGALIVSAIVVSIIAAMTRDFVVPLMYVRRVRVMEAWREFWELLCANKGGIVIYFLLKLALAIAAGIASLLLGCLGLLVAGLPVALVVGLGYGLVLALDITAWSWVYLWAVVPVGLVTMLGLAYWLVCVTLPVPVFFQSYALKYLEYVEPEAATI